MDSDSNLGGLSVADSPSSSSGGMMVPIAIGLTGVLLGGIALFMAFNGSGKSTETQLALEAATRQASALEDRLVKIEEKLSSLSSDYEGQERQLRTLATQTQAALNQVGQEMSVTRKQITATAEQVEEISEKMAKANTATVTSVAPSYPDTVSLGDGPSDGPSGSAAPGHREHTIASGETFAKLANKYNVSVDSILAANPDADPRRLQVGQKIKIPHNDHERE